MNTNNPQSTARIVVPVIIAVLVLWVMKTGPFAPKAPTAPSSKTSVYADSWYPIGTDLVFRYTTRGVFRDNPEEKAYPFHRKIIRKTGDNSWQASDSFRNQVIDNYYLTIRNGDIEVTSTGLNKNRYILLPDNFGLNATWQVSKTLRATADGVPEDLDIAVLVDGKKVEKSVEAYRVRYDRFYSKEVTVKPDWYFEGYAWFVRGLGMVKEDTTNVEIPKPNGQISYRETWEIKELTAIEGYN